MECILPGSSVHGILQVRILEGVAISSSRGSSWPRDWTGISCVGRWILLPLSYLLGRRRIIWFLQVTHRMNKYTRKWVHWEQRSMNSSFHGRKKRTPESETYSEEPLSMQAVHEIQGSLQVWPQGHFGSGYPCPVTGRVQGRSGWSHIIWFSVTNTSISQLKRKSKSN